MGRTIKILSTLICIGGISLISSSAFAASEEYWHINELNNLDAELRPEIEAECLGDIMCEEEKYYEFAENQGGEYAALYQFLSYGQFLISGINPSTNKISIYYSDTDFMMMDESEKVDLSEMYLFWLDDGMYHNDTREIYAYVREIKDGVPREGVHVIAAKNNIVDGSGWFTSNQEMEFSTENNLSDLRLPVHFVAVSLGSSVGLQNFDNCLNSADYAPGKECRAVFTATGRKYLPLDPVAPSSTVITEAIEENISTPEPTPEPINQPENTTTVVENTTAISENDSSGQNSDNLDISIPITEENPEQIKSIVENITKNESIKVLDATPSNVNITSVAENTTPAVETVPATTVATVPTQSTRKLDDELTNNINLKSGVKRDFPWGLILMMTVTSIILLWWFLPFSNKKSKK